MRNFMSEIWQNLKIELSIIIIAIIVYLNKNSIFADIFNNVDWLKYFNQDRLNGIATFFAITVGVYIAVVTVLAATEIGISKELLKRKLEKPLINVIIAGITEDLISIGFAIFVPLNDFTYYVLLCSLLVSISSFSKFIALLLTIFKVNMEQMSKDIDDYERYKDTMNACAKEILKYLLQKDKN